jgi:hypothetical protein
MPLLTGYAIILAKGGDAIARAWMVLGKIAGFFWVLEGE